MASTPPHPKDSSGPAAAPDHDPFTTTTRNIFADLGVTERRVDPQSEVVIEGYENPQKFHKFIKKFYEYCRTGHIRPCALGDGFVMYGRQHQRLGGQNFSIIQKGTEFTIIGFALNPTKRTIEARRFVVTEQRSVLYEDNSETRVIFHDKTKKQTSFLKSLVSVCSERVYEAEQAMIKAQEERPRQAHELPQHPPVVAQTLPLPRRGPR